ncbi:hypothetical protein FGIG_05579 [Fasciola gigantica]|uniref:Uncharacterized protein n=1 Tax=Fasciola gigantica TaxID=46835 RepID=A0A504YN97_FASGI|nr:hypothetical protein FGIG_05579 [Fasciola gigantica]
MQNIKKGQFFQCHHLPSQLFSYSVRGISIYPPTRKFPIFAHPNVNIDIDTRHLLKQFDLKRSCKNTVINELQDPLRGVVYHVDLKFWGTEESNSGYTKNKEMLEPTLSPLAIKARTARRGKKLEQVEVLEVFNFQREWAYNFTNSQLEQAAVPILIVPTKFASECDICGKCFLRQRVTTRLSIWIPKPRTTFIPIQMPDSLICNYHFYLRYPDRTEWI